MTTVASNAPLTTDTTAQRDMYAEVCRSYHAIADFRSKLLALLPLASGTGIFVLLEPGSPAGSSYLSAVGAFGLLASLGLYAYELRGIQRCNALIRIGAALEERMQAPAQYLLRPGPVAGFIDTRTASFVIYSAVIAAWTFIAVVGPLGRSASYVVAAVVLVTIFVASRMFDLDPAIEARVRDATP